MTAPPQRRWFTFSLRTLFVLVTVLSCWLGWNANIVRERKAVLAEIVKVNPDQEERISQQGPWSNDTEDEDFEFARISWIRRLMGDRPRRNLDLFDATDRKLIERAERAYPETSFTVWDEGCDYGGESRDSLYDPKRRPNRGTIFKTGIVAK